MYIMSSGNKNKKSEVAVHGGHQGDVHKAQELNQQVQFIDTIIGSLTEFQVDGNWPVYRERMEQFFL